MLLKSRVCYRIYAALTAELIRIKTSFCTICNFRIGRNRGYIPNNLCCPNLIHWCMCIEQQRMLEYPRFAHHSILKLGRSRTREQPLLSESDGLYRYQAHEIRTAQSAQTPASCPSIHVHLARWEFFNSLCCTNPISWLPVNIHTAMLQSFSW